ncbi:MAG: FliO/MopB family protein [Catonella sp.]|uniref:FliO/MopB family protein n=1 Tax=Catonella sp. TaxID=2382125 RepID=UPI003FA064CC
MFALKTMGTLGSIAQIFGMLVAFAVILAAAYFVSKYFGKYALKTRENSNIRVIETNRIAADKYLQIIEAGGKYFLIGISKSNISLISELSADQIKDFTRKEMEIFSFKEFFDKAKSKEK